MKCHNNNSKITNCDKVIADNKAVINLRRNLIELGDECVLDPVDNKF